jgi:hypothetical protein
MWPHLFFATLLLNHISQEDKQILYVNFPAASVAADLL